MFVVLGGALLKKRWTNYSKVPILCKNNKVTTQFILFGLLLDPEKQQSENVVRCARSVESFR